MTRVLLVDDEPLVLIGMQAMLNWAALGYEVVGTARNGAEALRAVQEKQPDIVVSDIRMPVMDGFALAEACHKDGSALPAFIMLTSYEEFDYVKRSMRLGVVDYLVKIDLTADSLTAALEHARATAEKEKKLRMPSPAPVSLDTFRDRLFLQLYGGLFTDRAVFDRLCAELGVAFKAPRHIVAVGSLQTPDLPTSQLVTLSTGVTRMAAETMPKYRPCRVTAMDLRHFSVLLPLEADEDPEAVLAPILKTAGQILYNYFSTAIYWAVGRPVNDILKISESQHDAFAALTMFNALDLLCKMAPGVFDDVWAEPKIRNMAEYIVNMHIAGPYYLNFADCSPLAGARGVREYLFGKRVGSLPLMTLAARDWAAVLAADPDPDRLHHPDDSEGINLFYHIQAAMAEREVTDFAETAAPAAPHDVWYPSVGILVSRRGAYALGGKAGSNADSHNHNDVGSVTLYRDGRPLLIDVGVETYSKKTFSPQRYEIWTMQSGWHNLPQFDPDGAKYDQQPGAAFAAADVTVTDALDGLAMDLAPAYGSVPGLGRYRRSVHLTDTGLTLHDETDYPGTVALTLMSVEKPTVDGDTVAFGALAAAAVTGADKIVTEAVPIADPRLRQAWPGTLYRTRIYFTQQLSLVIE